MIHHVFNASIVSGPETLVMPNLSGLPIPVSIVLLQESRLAKGGGPASVARYARELGFPTHEVPVKGRFDQACARALRKLWKQHPPQIVHAHGPKATLHALAAIALLAKKRRPRLVTTHHGVRAYHATPKMRLFEGIYERAVIPYCDACLTVCTSDKDILCGRGIPERKLSIHLNGVDRPAISGDQRVARRKEAREQWREALGMPGSLEDSYLVGIVGRLVPEKGHDLLLDAIAQIKLQAKAKSLRVICFGSGPLENTLRARTKELGLEGKVLWLGYRPSVAEELVGLDLLVSASVAEGLPIALIEAGWASLPVIALGVDGIQDLIEHEESGVLLPSSATPEDFAREILAMKASPDRGARIGQRFFERTAELFSRKAWVHRLLEIYLSLDPNLLGNQGTLASPLEALL